MFTGIITDIGTIEAINAKGEDITFRIACAYEFTGIDIGCSIACDGCCLTVTKKEKSAGRTLLDFDVSHETLRLTTLSGWKEGKKVNLERSLAVGAELGGHIVLGHVDAVGEVKTKEKQGDSWDFKVIFPEDLKKYIAPKGSVVVNGISLTVNKVIGNVLDLTIIPHTMEHTNFKDIKPGQKVNLEIDVIARYVANILENKDV